MTVVSNRITANGIAVNYRLEGPSAAQVVMFSNSFVTDYGMWDLQVPAFTKRYRVLRYDTRGHGGTQATPGPYSIDLLVADAVALLDALGLHRVHFVGLSMGGMIAQRLAHQHPDRLLSLCLSDTACRLPPESVWDERIALAREKGAAAFVRPMTERWLTRGYYERHPELVAKLGAMISRTSVDGLVGCAHAIKKMDHSAILAAIKVPTLMVVGEQDVGTPVAAAEVLHRAIDGSSLAVIPNAGHLPNIEQTETFDRTVLEFLGAHQDQL
jgi:3-oxoadipate enol-lactonase